MFLKLVSSSLVEGSVIMYVFANFLMLYIYLTSLGLLCSSHVHFIKTKQSENGSTISLKIHTRGCLTGSIPSHSPSTLLLTLGVRGGRVGTASPTLSSTSLISI